MDAEVWGPGAWLFLHSVTMTYPEKPGEMEKQFYKNFFANLGNVLPCPKCKEHYNRNLADSLIEGHLNSRRSLVEWLIEMHNKVNIKNGDIDLVYRISRNKISKPYVNNSKIYIIKDNGIVKIN